ncbi:MAG: UbiA family prenyltransferase [Desulfobacterales bacterium]|nr:UbiA family prenyltransferase [Desulfobacterales bacterium]
MNAISPIKLERIKLFLALSRTPHGLLDMATPAFAVLIYLQGFPSSRIILIGLLTAFAGYTAVYAFNDIIDYRSDRKRFGQTQQETVGYLDSIMARHPMAQGLLSFKEGIVWAMGWSAVALVGAYLLNPVCVLIFLAGAGLETVYCLLWRVSPLRAIVSGFVKNMGALAAIFAVDPHPDPVFMIVLFLFLFFWEIGGQNIPADWTDIEEDRRFKAKTIPVRLGEEKSAALALGCIIIAVFLGMTIFLLSYPNFKYIAAGPLVLLIGFLLLLQPAFKLYQTKQRETAMALFNKASYFPFCMLCTTLIFIF